MFSFYPDTQDIDSSSSPSGPRRPPVAGYSRMPKTINDLIAEALDTLVASANRSSAEIILYKRCYMTFKEANTPVYSVDDLKGLTLFSSFILEIISKIVQNRIKPGKTSKVKRKTTTIHKIKLNIRQQRKFR